MQLQFYAHGAQTTDRLMQNAAQFIATATLIPLPNSLSLSFNFFLFFLVFVYQYLKFVIFLD